MKLGLGTVQFGMDYGLVKDGRIPSNKDIELIFNEAVKNKVVLIDTACLYGKSEERIGNLNFFDKFKIVTKTPFFGNVSSNQIDEVIKSSFYQSLKKLKQNKIYAYLIHNADDLLEENKNIIWKNLIKFKEKNLVSKIGVSVYNKEKLTNIITKFPIDIVQFPLSILDQRFKKNNFLSKLKKKNIEIHTRSTFLQGIMLMKIDAIPERLKLLIPNLHLLHKLAKIKNSSILEVAINFVNNIDEIDHFICGIKSNSQFSELIQITKFNKCKFTESEVHSYSIDNTKVENIYKLLS